MYTFPIFSNFILVDNLEIDNQKLKNFCYELKKADSGRVLTNCGGWQSNLVPSNHPMLDDLLSHIMARVNNTNLILKLRQNISQEITAVWVNINQKHHYNLRHNHGLSYLSGVYYVEADFDTGDIVFNNPNSKIEQTYCYANLYSNGEIISEYNEFNSIEWKIPPKTGKLVIFPGYLDHYVLTNNTNKDRISISFNTAIVDNFITK